MPCHAMHPMQDYLWKDFYMHDKSICNQYALLCWQNFILAKSGCYIKALMLGGTNLVSRSTTANREWEEFQQKCALSQRYY
jgi:hypothetical protein